MAGAAVLILIGALYRSTDFPTLAVSAMLGSLILLIGILVDSSSIAFYQLLFDGGGLRNGIYAAVTGIGLAMLFFYGYREWDQPELDTEGA